MTPDAQRLDSLLAAIPHGVQENDLNGVITYSNMAHHKMLGYEPDELLGKTIFDLIYDPEKKEKLKDYLAYLAAEQPEPTPYITKNLCKDGRLITIQVDWAYQYNDQNDLIGFASIISDITKQKIAADEEKAFSDRSSVIAKAAAAWDKKNTVKAAKAAKKAAKKKPAAKKRPVAKKKTAAKRKPAAKKKASGRGRPKKK